MSDKQEIVTTNEPQKDDSSVRRIIAEELRIRGNRQVYVEADGGSRVSYANWLATMVWDGVTEGIVTFSDGSMLDIRQDPKQWLDLVKFLASHLDGSPSVGAQFNGVNVFKIYRGIDADRL